MEEKTLWKIQINFNNSKHELVSKLELDEKYYIGTETIEEVVYPKMLERLQELNWKGFGLWAQHEAIFKYTTLNDINYQRKNGIVVLDCEDHNCKFRSITTPMVLEKECVICFVSLDDKNRIIPQCFHSCLCKECFKKCKECLLCKKTFKK